MCLTKTTWAVFWYPFLNLVFKTKVGVCFFDILWYQFPYICSKICNGLCSLMCCMQNRSTEMSATPQVKTVVVTKAENFFHYN